MAKRKSRRKIIPNPESRYRPRLTAQEKAANHRIASAKHYARNPEIRERRRIQVAEKRAAIKLNRRRRDPPKKLKGVESSNGEPPAEVEADDCPSRSENEADNRDFDPSYSKELYSISETCRCVFPASSRILTTQGLGSVEKHVTNASESGNATTPSYEPSFWDARARSNINLQFPSVEASEEVDRGTAPSPTPDERIASQALAALATGVALSALSPRAPSTDSILDMANQLSALSSSTAAGPLSPPSILRGNVDCPSSVQLALMQVAALNSGGLTPPTEEDAAQWCLRPYLGGGGVDRDMHVVIACWTYHAVACHAVCRDFRRNEETHRLGGSGGRGLGGDRNCDHLVDTVAVVPEAVESERLEARILLLAELVRHADDLLVGFLACRSEEKGTYGLA
ncbi:hypothetical protein B0H11DRAFT_1929650 [Mycena galericulata]|nr:hypothetical protein B0H11DRAFT_1929650 [Mycena galericulata]